MLIFQSPIASLSPANVEVITDGNLANVEININFIGFIGSNPATYTNRSFGVPGIKNNISIISSIFFGFWNNLLFSILETFFSSQKSYTNFLPNFLTNKYIVIDIIAADTIINTVPQSPP